LASLTGEDLLNQTECVFEIELGAAAHEIEQRTAWKLGKSFVQRQEGGSAETFLAVSSVPQLELLPTDQRTLIVV
jgi:hypothetical protein